MALHAIEPLFLWPWGALGSLRMQHPENTLCLRTHTDENKSLSPEQQEDHKYYGINLPINV